MADEFTLEDLGVSPTQSPRDRVGTVVSGCHIEALLGAGAQGAVFAATSPDGRPVVVKFMAADLARKPELRARFQREWEALRKIGEHPHVVRVFSVHNDDSEPHIVMEHVNGLPLRGVLQRQGRLDPAEATRLALGVAKGLSAVHACGLIHRDVKPDNVMVTPEGLAKIVDFGLAKDVFLSTLTMPGQLLGTAFYMAPEQWDDTIKEDSRCDLFALGATLYHLLVGNPPFQGADVHEIADACLGGDYAPPRSLVQQIPPALEEVIVQLLMSELRYRYQSADEVAQDLERVLAGQPSTCPSLIDANGARFPLLPARRLTLGSDPKCQLRIGHPSVSPRHLQVRREETAFVVRGLKGSGPAFVDDAPLAKAHPLRDGERIRLGDVVLTFSEPRRRDTATSPWLRTVETLELPDPVVQQLIAMNDPRVVLTLIERLTPDPLETEHAQQTLAALFGADPERVMAARHSLLAKRAATPAQLAALTGQDPRTASAGLAPWLMWWSQARLHWPVQIAPTQGARSLRLRSLLGDAQPQSLDLVRQGVVLLGRDKRCTVRIDDPLVSRHHATIAGLHRRVSVSDAQSQSGTLLNAQPLHAAFFERGDTLGVGNAQWTLEAGAATAPPETAPGVHEIDTLSYLALEGLGHPSVATAAVGFLAQDLAWTQESAARLFGPDPLRSQIFREGLRATYAARRRDALRALPAILNADAGTDPGAWTELLAFRRRGLPPQVVPAGWLRSGPARA